MHKLTYMLATAGIVTVSAMVGFAGSALAQQAINGPNAAIGQNLDSNGAFSLCNNTAISNGHVVFGGANAINTPGSGGAHSQSAVLSTQDLSGTACGTMSGSAQRVEPPGIYPN